MSENFEVERVDSRSPELVSELILMRELWRFFVSAEKQSSASGCDASGQEVLAITCSLSLIRDGGLKREKVKDTFKEEQQKLYSKMIVGNHEDRSRS